MSTYNERRIAYLSRRLRPMLRHDGSSRQGFEQRVASIRSEMELLSVRIAKGNKEDGA